MSILGNNNKNVLILQSEYAMSYIINVIIHYLFFETIHTKKKTN